MLSKDLGNLLILLLNNHKQIERRRNPILLYTLYALFIVLLGLSALEANEMVPQGTVGFRVPWLMALLAPITVYLAQNGFGQLRDTIPSNLAYNLLILGIVILGLGVWGYHIGQAEYSLRAWLDRVASNIFFFVTLGHFIYTAINFNGLLKQRSLVYYVLYQPKLFRFYPFWIFAVLVVGLVEAAIHPLKAELHLRTVNRNIQADNMLFLGHINYAVTIFSDVSNQMYGDVKSSFNAAQLMLGQPEVLQSRTKQDIVIDHYRRAQLRFTFPEAGINLGIFLQLTNRNGEAGLQLRESANAFHDDRLWVNLAALYQLANQPDSVIALLKRAGEINPSNAAIFSNLAATYWAYGRPELAREFILTAHSIAPNAPYVLENYYYYHLAHDTSRIQLPATIDTLAANYTYTVNKALLALRQGDANTADAICRSLAGAEPSDALVLTHLLAQLRLDSLDNALSRLSWIGQHHPNVAPMAFHDVGVFFAEHKVPEMAMGYFNSASQMGSLPDSALAAGMLADMGYLAQAYEMYAALQNLHPNQNAIQELTRREKAMLDFAAGTETIYIGWNFQDITQNEALRLARYCGFTHNLERATKALEMCVAKDSADIRPYLELANIELQRGDSADLGFALAQVEAGIQHVNAQHPTALLLKARLQAKLNNTTQAAQTLAQVVVAPPDSTDWALAQASLLAAQGQAPAAIATLQAAHSRNPLNPEIIALAVKLMRQSNQAYDAYLFLSKAIDFNRRNRSYWMTLAELQTELGRHQEAVETYQMALSLSILPSEVAQVKALRNQAEQRAFAQEVQVYQSVTPSN
jgi:tetratricopeptide (TPR) repeat protein